MSPILSYCPDGMSSSLCVCSTEHLFVCQCGRQWRFSIFLGLTSAASAAATTPVHTRRWKHGHVWGCWTTRLHSHLLHQGHLKLLLPEGVVKRCEILPCMTVWQEKHKLFSESSCSLQSPKLPENIKIKTVKTSGHDPMIPKWHL